MIPYKTLYVNKPYLIVLLFPMKLTWLIIAWLLFGSLHSVMAASTFKNRLQSAMKGNYRFYRIFYSLIATLSLIAVLWYHFSLNSLLLWNNSVLEKTIAFILSVPAVIVMSVSIKKYFIDLSGVNVFMKSSSAKTAHLELTGLHKYVRHPLYFGTLLFAWCYFLWQPSASNLISCICITLYTRIGVYFEERKLVREFGEDYIAYTKKVPMLVPGLSKLVS